MNWSIGASRNAVTADVDLLLPLLHDPDPEVRVHACYAVATATAGAERITDARRARLATEPAPEVRASLVLAVAELAREHAGAHRTAAWLQALWSGSAQPADIRVPALAWPCLVDGPVPEDLRTVLGSLVTADLARVLDTVPWIGHVRHRNGLAETVRQMLNDASPGRHLDAAALTPDRRTGTAAAPLGSVVPTSGQRRGPPTRRAARMSAQRNCLTEGVRHAGPTGARSACPAVVAAPPLRGGVAPGSTSTAT